MRINKKTILSVSIFLAVLALLFIIVAVKAQDQSVDQITERLNQYQVPIKSVNIVSRIPFSVDFILRSDSPEKQSSIDDLWNLQLIRREAGMGYELGVRINEYTITRVDPGGNTTYWEKNFLYLDQPSQNPKNSAVSPKMSNEETRAALLAELAVNPQTTDLYAVENDALDKNNQILIAQITVKDLESANQLLPGLIPQLKRALDQINAEQGANLVLCRMRVVDQSGNTLLNYVWDAETREETSNSVEGLASWFHGTEPNETPGIESTDAYPAPKSENEPVEETQPYPEP